MNIAVTAAAAAGAAANGGDGSGCLFSCLSFLCFSFFTVYRHTNTDNHYHTAASRIVLDNVDLPHFLMIPNIHLPCSFPCNLFN